MDKVCPKDGAKLSQREFEGVMIDNCPQCRGVWLDSGELEKIAEKVKDDSDDHGSNFATGLILGGLIF